MADKIDSPRPAISCVQVSRFSIVLEMYGRLLIWTHCLENERQEKCIAMEAEKRVDLRQRMARPKKQVSQDNLIR